MPTAVKTPVKTDSKRFTLDENAIDLIKKTVAQGATDTELQLFLYYAQKTGLDPLARQIYFMKRNVRKSDGTYDTKMTIQTSIDGFRLIAERSGNYAGQSEPEFLYGNDKNVPHRCSITIYKFAPNGERYPASVGVAYWNEYVPPNGQNFMWQKMPHTMLAKVAEALGLRKAFPQELSGLYTDEEMEQSEDQRDKKTRDMKDRAEKWLTTVPKKIISILSIYDNDKFEKEREDLMNQLETAKKAVTAYPDLVKHIEKCIQQAKEDLYSDDEDVNYDTRLEKKEEKQEGIKEAQEKQQREKNKSNNKKK